MMAYGMDFDACEERWKYYQRRYPDFGIDLEVVRFTSNDKSKRGKWTYRTVELSGDCFFNFNEKKIQAFIKNISCTSETKRKLKECSERHHTNENCVLMPVTGGLNNVKGKIYYRGNGFVVRGIGASTDKCYDRPDTFLVYLNDFFEQKKNSLNLLSAGEYLSNSIFKEALQSFNFADLYIFLDAFEDVYEYCNLFYGIDEVFADRMIEEGKEPIIDDAGLNRYMLLAEDFWKIQADILEKNMTEKEDGKNVSLSL